jgi:hypothetical protein
MDYIKHVSDRITKGITPVIRDFLLDSYENSDKHLEEEQIKQDPGGKSLLKFQKVLQKVPLWIPGPQMNKHIEEVEKHIKNFEQVLASLFVAYAKMIINAIRITSKKKSLNVKIPTKGEFIHQCFINVAHNLYENPFVMKVHDDSERSRELTERINECLHETISDMVPLPEILQEHIPMSGGSINFGGDDADEVGEELAPPSSEEMAKEEGVTPSPITESPFPQGPAVQPVVTESKEISVDSKDAEELFSDAPEQKPTSKVNGEVVE